MRKIKTIFERDWKGNRGVVDNLIVNFDFSNAIATEKLDGMNIRVTVRNEQVVRVEKRRNPNKKQKKEGIVIPWYVDAKRDDPADKWIFNAVENTDFIDVPDGEWSAEAIGPKIQGNPLNLEKHELFIFSLEHWREKIVFADAPISFAELKEWLPKQKSKIGNNCGIEGIVWHNQVNGDMVKIKVKDFK
ncbi:MAG: hypothetical protein ACOCQR_00810 [bacterium]